MKYFITSVVVVLLLLFWAPWITAHIEEDYLEKEFRKLEEGSLCGVYGTENSSEHDGVGIAWAPFGREIIGCKERIYVPFWEFPINPRHLI